MNTTIIWDLFRYNIPNFFRNIWVQRTALWNARSWDHSGVYMYMRNQLNDMSVNQRKYGLHLNKEKQCDRIDICVKVIDRLLKDEYDIERWDFIEDNKAPLFGMRMEPKYDFPSKSRTIYNLSDKQQEIDKEYLFKTLQKRLHHWWD